MIEYLVELEQSHPWKRRTVGRSRQFPVRRRKGIANEEQIEYEHETLLCAQCIGVSLRWFLALLKAPCSIKRVTSLEKNAGKHNSFEEYRSSASQPCKSPTRRNMKWRVAVIVCGIQVDGATEQNSLGIRSGRYFNEILAISRTREHLSCPFSAQRCIGVLPSLSE